MNRNLRIRSLKLGFLIGYGYLKRKALWVIAGLIFLAILIFIQFQFSLFYSSNSLRVGLVGTYQEHDLPSEVTNLVSDSLVRSDENYRIQPNLVSGWETNNDATEFKFKLKDDLKWSDGSKVYAKDIDFAIPNTEVSYPDDKTIQFKLKEPYSPLPSLLVKPVFKKGTLIGIGPYEITNIEKSRVFITKLTLTPMDSNLPLVYVRFYPNEKVAVTGFEMGEVESILGLNNPKIFSSNPQVSLKQETDFSKIVTILYQTKDSMLGNRSLRQALSFSAPEVVGEETANSPYPSKSWAYNGFSKKYLSNPDEAKSALERAKSAISKEQLSGEIILTTTPNLEEVGKNLVKAWKDLGFDAKLRIESGISQNFQALLITQSIPIDPDQYSLWHATQTKTNLSGYSDKCCPQSKRVDKDLEDARKVIPEEERKEKYFDFQKTLLEDAPATFLYFPKYNIVYLKKVGPLLDKILKR